MKTEVLGVEITADGQWPGLRGVTWKGTIQGQRSQSPEFSVRKTPRPADVWHSRALGLRPICPGSAAAPCVFSRAIGTSPVADRGGCRKPGLPVSGGSSLGLGEPDEADGEMGRWEAKEGHGRSPWPLLLSLSRSQPGTVLKSSTLMGKLTFRLLVPAVL